MPQFNRIFRLVVLTTIAATPAVFAQGTSTPGSAPPTASGASAVVPHLIKFSGTLLDEQGHALKGPVGVTFSLYAQQSGGAALWVETQNVKPDASGNYTVLLGSTSTNGIPEELFASGEARWLGMQPEGQAEQPRILLVSVPYALKAGDAQTLGGLPPSAFALSITNPPTSTTAVVPLAASTPNSATTAPLASACSPLTSDGLATVGKVAKFTTPCKIESGQITDTGTAIGIGNASPAAKLDVAGGGIFRGTLQLSSIGTATALAGKSSQPFDLLASSFNKTLATGINQHFRWQAEPVGNNTTAPSGKLNLLYAAGAAIPAETGLSISNKGLINFVPGQTYPGVSVGLSAPSADFKVSGSPVTKSGTLALAWNVAPTSSDKPNAFVKRDSAGSFHAAQIFGDLGVEGTTALTCSGCAGVSGVNTGGGLGVQGLTAGDAPAVLGQNSSTSGGIADGVHGVTNSASASGVAGVNNSGGIGVFGVGGTGTFGTSNTAKGTGVNGVFGPNSSIGAALLKEVGVWGDTGKFASVGVLGTADDGTAGIFENNSPSSFPTLQAIIEDTNTIDIFEAVNFTQDPPPNCSIDHNGNLNCTGSKNAVVPLDGGRRKVALSAIESPQNWFEDFGSAQLVNGVAVVRLDPDFMQAANTEMNYRVFPVPNGDCKGLYVTNKTANSFEVRELGGGTSSVSFDYRITAIRRKYETVRFADHTNDPDPRKMLEQMRKTKASSSAPAAVRSAPLPVVGGPMPERTHQ